MSYYTFNNYGAIANCYIIDGEFIKRLIWKVHSDDKFSYTFDYQYGSTAYWYETLNRYNPAFTKQHWDQLVSGEY